MNDMGQRVWDFVFRICEAGFKFRPRVYFRGDNLNKVLWVCYTTTVQRLSGNMSANSSGFYADWGFGDAGWGWGTGLTEGVVVSGCFYCCLCFLLGSGPRVSRGWGGAWVWVLD